MLYYRWRYAYMCINMCIGFVLHIIENPVGNLSSRTHLRVQSSKGCGHEKPAEHPVRGLKPVHHL